jgi:hypothetical protein
MEQESLWSRLIIGLGFVLWMLFTFGGATMLISLMYDATKEGQEMQERQSRMWKPPDKKRKEDKTSNN